MQLKILITGANGFIGQYIAHSAVSAGHSVTSLGHSKPLIRDVKHIHWSLGDPVELTGHDILIHAAFHHIPGRYRGGEGQDSEGFLNANLTGSIQLFKDAQSGGVAACLFLSTRAVFDGYPPGTLLTENLPPRPTTLYGTIKAEAEAALSALSSPEFRTANIRPTGVFGMPLDGSAHKWQDLFADFRNGKTIEPHIASEVHAADLASATMLILGDRTSKPLSRGDIVKDNPLPRPSSAARFFTPPKLRKIIQPITGGSYNHLVEKNARSASGAAMENSSAPYRTEEKFHLDFHISNLVLDRHDLLKHYALRWKLPSKNVPPPQQSQDLCLLDCSAVASLGWMPLGLQRLSEMLENSSPACS